MLALQSGRSCPGGQVDRRDFRAGGRELQEEEEEENHRHQS